MVHHSALHPQPHPISHPRQLLLPPGSPEALAIRRTRIHNDDLTKSYPSSHNEDTLRLSKAHNPDSDAITLKPAPNFSAEEETGKAPSSSAEHQSTNATTLPRLDSSHHPTRAGVFAGRSKARWRIRAAGISPTRNGRPTPTG